MASLKCYGVGVVNVASGQLIETNTLKYSFKNMGQLFICIVTSTG